MSDGVFYTSPPSGPAIVYHADREIVVITEPGFQGPPGAPGSGSGDGTVTLTVAGATLSGHRLVTKQADGSAVYADNTTVGSAPLWLTLGAATTGNPVTAQAAGVVDEPSWTWTPGPLYLGTAGALVQTVPIGSGVYLVQVGYATSPTSIALERWPTITLS